MSPSALIPVLVKDAQQVHDTLDSLALNAQANNAFILSLGGNDNMTSARGSIVMGGDLNLITGERSAILGGSSNDVQGSHSAVINGNGNSVTGIGVTVVGSDNAIAGSDVLVAGDNYSIENPALVDLLIFGDALEKTSIDASHAALFFPADPEGKVAVGTDHVPTGTRLMVKGGDIRVEGGSFIDDGDGLATPDYVFEPGYELPTLEALGDFIRANRHLPNMPSASEVERHGIDLGENQMKILEKVEELTLYTLQQHEQIQKQQAQLADQQQQIDDLRREMAVFRKTLDPDGSLTPRVR